MAIEWSQDDRGIVLTLQVQPGSRKTEIRGEYKAALKVAVTTKPENGKANAAVIEFLARTWGLSKSQLNIISGETSRQKHLLIRELSAGEFSALLATHLSTD